MATIQQSLTPANKKIYEGFNNKPSPEKDIQVVKKTKNLLFNTQDDKKTSNLITTENNALTSNDKVKEKLKLKSNKPVKKQNIPLSNNKTINNKPDSASVIKPSSSTTQVKKSAIISNSNAPIVKNLSNRPLSVSKVSVKKANSTDKMNHDKEIDKKEKPKVKKSKDIKQIEDGQVITKIMNADNDVFERKNLMMNLELTNKHILDSQEVLKEQTKHFTKFNNLKQYINSFDYNIEKILIKAENDEFSSIASKLCNNIADVTNSISKYNEEVKNIQCNVKKIN